MLKIDGATVRGKVWTSALQDELYQGFYEDDILPFLLWSFNIPHSFPPPFLDYCVYRSNYAQFQAKWGDCDLSEYVDYVGRDRSGRHRPAYILYIQWRYTTVCCMCVTKAGGQTFDVTFVDKSLFMWYYVMAGLGLDCYIVRQSNSRRFLVCQNNVNQELRVPFLWK